MDMRLVTPEDIERVRAKVSMLTSQEIFEDVCRPNYATPLYVDPRPEVEALFQCVLGDNIGHETVQQLIDGVVDLIKQRESI